MSLAALRHWLLAAVAVAAALAASPARALTTTTITPRLIAEDASYHGAAIEVRGVVSPGSQVIVRVMGPTADQIFNRRGRIGGLIWGGVEHVTFHDAPSLYALYTSGALPTIAGPALRDKLLLGFDTLAQRVEVEPAHIDPALLFENFIKLKQKEGLYRIQAGGVNVGDQLDGRCPFAVRIPLSAAAPPGDIEVAVFEVAGGSLVGEATDHVRLVRVGMPAVLHAMAHEQGLEYGFLALGATLATGLLIGLLGNWRSRTRPRLAWDPMAIAGEPSELAMRAAPAPGGKLLRAVADPLLPAVVKPRTTEEVGHLRDKYTLFRRLLAINNELLESLAELEEESSWTSYQHPRVRMGIRALFDGTADMVEVLNQLSGGHYFDLANVVSGIRHDVSEYLAKAAEREDPRLVLRLADITSRTATMVGGKAANLARVDADLHFPVPESLVITTEAYREFLENAGLASKLRTVLAPARLDATDDFARRCELAQELVDHTEVPQAVRDAIAAAGASLGTGLGFAVRSSAAGEDSEISFAGQFESVLNVPSDQLVEAWKQVVRSRYSPRAVFYRRALGIAEVDTPMAVLVQRMVAARASGVLFTRRPDDPKAAVLLVSAVGGLGRDASMGTASADEFSVSRKAPHVVLERRIASKHARLASAAGGGVQQLDVPSGDETRPAVTDAEVARLAEVALTVERYFDKPQDLEWAIDEQGALFVLQARPLRTGRPAKAERPRALDAEVLLEGGEPVWPGRAVGPVHVLRSADDESRLPLGAVLVVPELLADCVRLLPRVSGVVVGRGSVLGHAASIVREFRVPSLFGVGSTIDKLPPGEMASLDAAARRVYAGAVWPELQGELPVTLMGRRCLGLPPVLSSKVTRLSGSMFMSSWACQSLHDVIRYAHEMAIQTMFDIGDRLRKSRLGGVLKVECPPPVFLHLIDLGGGVRSGAVAHGSVTPDDIVCVPFRSLWRGLGDDRLERERLDGVGVGSFASVMASTLAGDAARGLGLPNYACVTDAYMNLNSRQAYHFAVVDAFLSANQNNNHISVRLRGGGAAPWQRSLRVEFMSRVLRLHRFVTQVNGELLNASCRGIDEQGGAEALVAVGHLLRFSAQLDMWMTSESHVRRYVELFLQAEAKLVAEGQAEAAPEH
jgi:pyruvate,water dikinase